MPRGFIHLFSNQDNALFFPEVEIHYYLPNDSSLRHCPACTVTLNWKQTRKRENNKKRANSSEMERSNVNELMTQSMHAGAFKVSTSHTSLSSQAFHQTHSLALGTHLTLHDAAALLAIVTISRRQEILASHTADLSPVSLFTHSVPPHASSSVRHTKVLHSRSRWFYIIWWVRIGGE